MCNNNDKCNLYNKNGLHHLIAVASNLLAFLGHSQSNVHVDILDTTPNECLHCTSVSHEPRCGMVDFACKF